MNNTVTTEELIQNSIELDKIASDIRKLQPSLARVKELENKATILGTTIKKLLDHEEDYPGECLVIQPSVNCVMLNKAESLSIYTRDYLQCMAILKSELETIKKIINGK